MGYRMRRVPRVDCTGHCADPAASHLARTLRPLITFGGCLLVVACLYWGQAILIPIALAILITFLLGPVVNAFRRMGLPQTPAVLFVVILAVSVAGGIGWALAHQATTLAHDLPQYRSNIARKIADIRAAQRGSLANVRDSATDALRELKKPEGPAARQTQPVPVVVEPPTAIDWLPGIPRLLTSVGLVILLVVFMLIRRQELRTRLIRVCGHGRLTVTTKALDEAGSRISRYLLMQTVLNSCFGLALGLGLLLIGLPYALLWGFLAALLRFVPYLGTWIAATVPIMIAFAVFDGWTKLGLVLGLVVGVEFVIAFVLEPWLYGKSAGVSEVALLVAAAFWTALWGPVGLLLATPMTVCLVVLARNCGIGSCGVPRPSTGFMLSTAAWRPQPRGLVRDPRGCAMRTWTSSSPSIATSSKAASRASTGSCSAATCRSSVATPWPAFWRRARSIAATSSASC